MLMLFVRTKNEVTAAFGGGVYREWNCPRVVVLVGGRVAVCGSVVVSNAK